MQSYRREAGAEVTLARIFGVLVSRAGWANLDIGAEPEIVVFVNLLVSFSLKS